jgi:hypothetical protein
MASRSDDRKLRQFPDPLPRDSWPECDIAPVGVPQVCSVMALFPVGGENVAGWRVSIPSCIRKRVATNVASCAAARFGKTTTDSHNYGVICLATVLFWKDHLPFEQIT